MKLGRDLWSHWVGHFLLSKICRSVLHAGILQSAGYTFLLFPSLHSNFARVMLIARNLFGTLCTSALSEATLWEIIILLNYNEPPNTGIQAVKAGYQFQVKLDGTWPDDLIHVHVGLECRCQWSYSCCPSFGLYAKETQIETLWYTMVRDYPPWDETLEQNKGVSLKLLFFWRRSSNANRP